jgi:hypothetical protein
MLEGGKDSIFGVEGSSAQGPNISPILQLGKSESSDKDRPREENIRDFSQLVDMFSNCTSRHANWIDLTLETEKFGMSITSYNIVNTDTDFVIDNRFYWRIVQPLQIRRHPETNFDETIISHGIDTSLGDAIRHMMQAASVYCCLTLSNIVDYISEHRAMQFLTNKTQFWGSGSEAMEEG